MAKKKRQHGHETENDSEAQFPTKRLKRTDENDMLAKIYDQLADDLQPVRIKAAGDLVKYVTADSHEQRDRLDRVEQRLIRGLCSGRKAARLGFSIALAEIFRLKFDMRLSLPGPMIVVEATISIIDTLTTPEGKVGGQEQRDHLLGRRFAYQALLHSDVLASAKLHGSQWQALVHSIVQLAGQKQWLRREVLGMLHDYLSSASGQLVLDRVESILQAAASQILLKTPEGVGLWITIRHRYPDAKVPPNVWRSDDPLSSENMQILAKALTDASDDADPSAKANGTRQSTPSFTWKVILARLSSHDQISVSNSKDRLAAFWTVCVSETMFSRKASSERKALGLQVFSEAIASLPATALSSVVDCSVIRCILDQRAKPENNLFEASKAALNQMIVRAKKEPDAVGILIRSLLEHGGDNFDQRTKTKTVESMISAANDTSLDEIVEVVRSRMPPLKNVERSETEASRRSQADILLTILRTHKDFEPSLIRGSSFESSLGNYSWPECLLEALSYTYIAQEAIPVFHQRLMSALNILMVGPLRQAIQAPLFVVHSVRSNTMLHHRLSLRAEHAVDNAYNYIDDMNAGTFCDAAEGTTGTSKDAFALLFALSMLQVFNEEADAVEILEDLIMCYQSLDESGDVTTMLVELLLSFVSKPSALFRKLAEQVFAAVAAEMTEDSLQSLLNILEQKESLSGQQELFAENGETDEAEINGLKDDEGEAIDVEDASDIEIVNGEQIVASDSEEDSISEEGDDSASDAHAGADDDEELAFDKKLAEALGTGRFESDDSDDDGSDMDDEQMMALEPHLTTIFKERQKTTSKKQERKDAKENIVNFKNRVLDLLAIFVKSQHSSILALDIILPLISLVRTTKNKQTGEKAFAVLKQYFETCNKHKAFPEPGDGDDTFEILRNVLKEMKHGGSKLYANACSRSALFLTKVLINWDKSWYEHIAKQYADLLSEWWLDPKSKVHPSIFTEWTSWSIATRKQEGGQEK